NPYDNFVGGDPQGFCCDQEVILEPARNALIWSRMGAGEGSNLINNHIDLSVSTDGGNSFCTYAFAGGDIGQPNTTLDYPHLSVTNDNLFITYNVFDASGAFADMGLARWPLDQMATCSGLSYTFWSTDGWSWALAQGQVTNTGVQYLGDTRNSAGTFRLYTQSDADTILNFVDRAVPAWTFTNRGGADCTVPSGVNPCARLDQRITGGWAGPEQVGFFWTVQQGGGFPFPYVDAVLINRDDLSVAGQPFIWSPSNAFTYGAAATNAHGDVGINTLLVGGGNYPTPCMGIWDSYTAPPPDWQINCPIASDGWDTAGMGDYITVRTYQPASTLFSASSYISAAGTYTGYYFVFGRQRDANAWLRFSQS
ncbi:MAG: hypothetical protein M3008_04740, partial [Chloroflexota bacterium]|nr:hypothetical protein [Chloroflexota bacterium]